MTIISNEGYHGEDGYDAGFEVEVTGSFSYGVVFTATFEVVRQICLTQEHLWMQGFKGVDRLVMLERGELIHLGGDNDPGYYYAYYPSEGDGLYRGLGFGWVWHEVDPADCKVVYR